MSTSSIVYIMRGISGSGKSTLAKKTMDGIVEHSGDPDSICICSADDYFMGDDGVYRFDKKRIGDAHAKCLRDFIDCLHQNVDVIVDNTNTQLWEFRPYERVAQLAGAQIIFLEFVPPGGERELNEYVLACASRNQHGVSYTQCMAQAKRFQLRQGQQK